MPTMIRAMSAGLPESTTLQTEHARTLQIGGNAATQIDARGGPSQLSYTQIACGKRVVSLLVGVRAGSVRAIRDRILGSFDCQPIAAQEPADAAATAPFGIDDPALLAGWHRVDEIDWFAMSNGELLVTISQRPRLQRVAEDLDRYLPTIIGSMGLSWIKGRIETRQIQGGERTFHHGQILEDGEAMNGVVTVWHCAGRGDSVMAIAISEPGDKLEPAIDLLAKLRCARPDDPPLPLAPAPAESPL